MSISRQRIRQIIKEELSRAIREGNPDDDEDESPSSGDLVIKRADLEVEYNDAETGSQQANIEVKFTWMDSPGDASVLITSFTERSSYIVDRIADEINYAINLMSDTEDQNFVNNLQVKMAMGKKLAQLINEMEQLQEEYDQQARYL